MSKACRLCGRPARSIGGRDEISLHRCSDCGLVSGFAVEERSVAERYRGYYEATQPPAPSARYQEWLETAEAGLGRGRLLEVGAGNGGFVRAAVARGWRADATEVSESGLESLRNSGATVFAGDVREAAFREGTFDLVVSIEVLEHLSDPREHLAELARVTRRGGLLLLTTPNFDGLSRRLLGPRWRVIDPEHVSYFNQRTLGLALRGAGYRRATVKGRSLDLLTWRGTPSPGGVVPFDPARAAAVRDRLQASAGARFALRVCNLLLAWSGLGDSLIAWAER